MFHLVESSLSSPFDKVSKLFRKLCQSSVLETNLNVLCLVFFFFFLVILVWVSRWFVCLDLSFWLLRALDMLWRISWVCVFKHARHQLKKKRHECVLGERGVFDMFWVLFLIKNVLA